MSIKNVIHDLISPVLSDRTIEKYMKKGLLIETGLSPYQLQPNSVDLVLSNEISVLEPNHTQIRGFTNEQGFPDHYDVDVIDVAKPCKFNEVTKINTGITIGPGEFLLMRSREVLNIPNGIIAFVQGRSSIARLGIQTEQAGLIDTGFRGSITFEVYNENKFPVIIYPGMRIAQVYFFKSQYAEMVYGSEHRSKYFGQIHPTGSRIHEDPELRLRQK